MTSDYRLGIIRYAANYDKYFKASLEEKGLSYELLYEFHYVLIMSKENPLAKKDEIHYSDLKPFIEIAHADPYKVVPLSRPRLEKMREHRRRQF